MRTLLRWTGRALAGLAILLVVAVGTVYALSARRMGATYTVLPERPLVIPTDSGSIAHGHRIAMLRGCTSCHGPNLGGGIMIDHPVLGRVVPANLTSGRGGRASASDPAAFERAVRHGVGRDGRSLFVMPAQEFQELTDDDIASLVAWVRTLPPVDNALPSNRLLPVGRALYLAGKLNVTPAASVQHDVPHVRTLAMAETPEYGRYMAAGCVGCHGPGFSGGKNPEPGRKDVGNISPDSATGIGRWSEEQFLATLRSAVRPDGTVIDTTSMPIAITRAMTDTELRAIYRYLRTVPARPRGSR